MFRELLLTLIADKDVESMTCHEARSIVDNFLTIVTIKTNSWSNQQKVDYFIKDALDFVGLGYFA